MATPTVEAVLINWRRPENVEKIVRALRSQSIDLTLTLCDCHQEAEYALSNETLAQIDRVYRWHHNLGPYSRYAPSAGFDHEYTFFTDDDIVPGKRCLEHFLDHATGSRFGVLGQLGRRLKPDGIYRPRSVARTSRIEEVDLVVQAYFVRTRHLGHVANARWELEQESVVRSEDDIILAYAMQKARLGSYLTPSTSDEETLVDRMKLAEPYSLSSRSDHLDRRTALLADAHRLGWRSYGSRRFSRVLWETRGRMLSAEIQLRRWRRLRAEKQV